MKNSKLKNVQGSTFFSDGIHGGTETKRLSVSLLQIGGADARNLAEIKRRHGPKYTSMYILGLRVCNANSLLHRTTAVHGGTEKPFANRRCRYKEIGKKVPQAYLRYVEDTFLPYDAVDAPYIYKRGGNQYC